MNDPLSDSAWKADGLCYDLSLTPEGHVINESFFGETVEERQLALSFCNTGDGCPIRKRCLRFALESQQLWGVWGGRDESEIRRDLWMNSNGTIGARARWPRCPECKSKNHPLVVSDQRKAEITCTNSECGFSWRSHTTRMGIEESQRSLDQAV